MSVGESSVAGRYRDGFSECAQEVDRFLASVSGLGHDTRYRLMNHLATCIKQPPPPPPNPSPASAPAVNPGIYGGIQLPATTGRVDFGPGCGPPAPGTSFDGRRRSVSVAALPYTSDAALFPGFAPPPTTRLSVSSLLSVCERPSATAFGGGGEERSSSFRPIEPPLSRCSPAVSGDEFDAEMAACDAESDAEDADVRPVARDVPNAARPLTEKNDNSDNIARGFMVAQKREASPTDADVHVLDAPEESLMMFMIHGNVKDEHVWRPW